MAYNFAAFDARVNEIEEHLKSEFLSLRTGRASVSLLDKVRVEAYGAQNPIEHMASVALQDARTLYVTPWDKTLIGALQKGIDAANLGVSTAPDGTGIRVIFPELTGDRRALLMKVVGQKLEEARITLRSEREKVWGAIQNAEKEGTISEDEKFRAKDDLQKRVDAGNERFTTLADTKRAELAE